MVSQGAISAPMFSMKGPSMVQSAYPTAFPLKHQQKVSSALLCSSFLRGLVPRRLKAEPWFLAGGQDLRLALGLAEAVAQPTPVAAAANELYKAAKSLGLSDQDFSAVIEALKTKAQQQQ